MLLILLIFVGQVVSAPFETCITDNDENSTHSMMMADMPNHDMQNMTMDHSDSSMMAMDCCGDECQCPMDMCLTMAFINTHIDTQIQQFSETFIFQETNSVLISYSNDSLYRPPIFS